MTADSGSFNETVSNPYHNLVFQINQYHNVQAYARKELKTYASCIYIGISFDS